MMFSEPLTEEMVENTKSFYEYCVEQNWEKLFEKKRKFFKWFYNPDFISQSSDTKPNDPLTEYEMDYINQAVQESLYNAWGYDNFYSWWYEDVVVDWSSKTNGIVKITVEEEK